MSSNLYKSHNFTYAYEPKVIWSAWNRHNINESQFVGLTEWINDLAQEFADSSGRNIDPKVIVAGGNEQNRRWWEVERYTGTIFTDLFDDSDNINLEITQQQITQQMIELYDSIQTSQENTELISQNLRYELTKALCQLKGIGDDGWFIGLPYKPESLKSEYAILAKHNQSQPLLVYD